MFCERRNHNRIIKLSETTLFFITDFYFFRLNANITTNYSSPLFETILYCVGAGIIKKTKKYYPFICAITAKPSFFARYFFAL